MIVLLTKKDYNNEDTLVSSVQLNIKDSNIELRNGATINDGLRKNIVNLYIH